MTQKIPFFAIILAGIVGQSYAQDHSLVITPVYQWTDSKELPNLFIDNPTANPLYKPTMFLKAGPGAGGEYWYYPMSSLSLLLDPNEKAMAALNNCGKGKRIMTRIFFLAALAFCVTGNCQKPLSDAMGWYYGAGACLTAGFICLYIPSVTNADRLRIIEMHNKAIGH